MATALFIKRADLVKNTALSGNVDTDKFIQFIKLAQEIHIQNYLGTDLYNKISRNVAETIQLNRETQKLDEMTIRNMSELEFKEARFIDSLRKKGCNIDDEAEYVLAKEPELLVYAILENLKGTYAPEL